MDPSSKKQWWLRIVSFVLKELKELLVHFGLYATVMAIQYGIPQSNYHFYAMLE